jgi:hypothetical protein
VGIWRAGAVCIAVIAALLLADVGLKWPLWLLPTIAVALMAAYIGLGHRRQPAPILIADTVTGLADTQPPEMSNKDVADVLLPSQDTDYHFIFCATVVWSPAAPGSARLPANLAARAVEDIVRRASEITSQRAASSASLVRWELSAALGEMKADAAGHVRARADSVELFLPVTDQERLDKLAGIRKDETVWEHERRYEQSRRRYLSGDVLKNPGSAVVWWLSRNNDQVEKAVRDIGLLVQLYSAANNTDLPAAFRHVVPDTVVDDFFGSLGPSGGSRDAQEGPDAPSGTRPAADSFDDFLTAMRFPDGDPQRVLFARQVAMAANANGRPDIAAELIHRFDPPCSDEGEPEPDPEPDGTGSVPQQGETALRADNPF